MTDAKYMLYYLFIPLVLKENLFPPQPVNFTTSG